MSSKDIKCTICQKEVRTIKKKPKRGQKDKEVKQGRAEKNFLITRNTQVQENHLRHIFKKHSFSRFSKGSSIYWSCLIS